jgi:hypothetical protein
MYPLHAKLPWGSTTLADLEQWAVWLIGIQCGYELARMKPLESFRALLNLSVVRYEYAQD